MSALGLEGLGAADAIGLIKEVPIEVVRVVENDFES